MRSLSGDYYSIYSLTNSVTVQPIAMEDLCRKIPLIRKNIFEELDDKSFVNFKVASREINDNLRNERFYWIRVLSTYHCLFGDFKDSWARVVKRTPPEFVKKLFINV